MLQPENMLMKRGALLGSDPREDRKVCAAVSFFDYSAGTAAVFSGCYPATVSDSETVFLCAIGSN